MVNLKNQNNSKNLIKTMIALIITSLLGDYSGIAEEVEKQLQYQDKKQESDEVVSIHQFDMLSRCVKMISGTGR